ncbi:YopX family protein [Streptococcus suis]|uniref:YopX family protein n=2 Tax=Streptococcus suis TaxID=1307 RepID=UPI000CF5EA7D|nr:YopX family protein [Streptococcus suis]
MVVPKFRAWDTFDEDMVNDIFFSWQDCGYESLNECLSDERWKFMQSTGLFDKNGKEIFGGDVIRVNYTDDDSPWTDAIIWSPKDCAWYLKSNKELLGFAMDEPDIIVEVIGNIYENPELVEVNND